MQATINTNVEKWLSGNFDPSVKEEIKKMQSSNPDELADSFYAT
jgi:phosphoglucomutase